MKQVIIAAVVAVDMPGYGLKVGDKVTVTQVDHRTRRVLVLTGDRREHSMDMRNVHMEAEPE